MRFIEAVWINPSYRKGKSSQLDSKGVLKLLTGLYLFSVVNFANHYGTYSCWLYWLPVDSLLPATDIFMWLMRVQ